MSKKEYMANYRARLKAADPIVYKDKMKVQKKKWRAKKRAYSIHNCVVYENWKDTPDCDVVSLYFDPPEGITREECDERKRLRMVKYNNNVNNDGNYIGNLDMFGPYMRGNVNYSNELVMSSMQWLLNQGGISDLVNSVCLLQKEKNGDKSDV